MDVFIHLPVHARKLESPIMKTSHHSFFAWFGARPVWAAASCSALLLAACGGGGSDDSSPQPQPQPEEPSGPQSVTIEFAAQADGAAAQCGTVLHHLGTGHASAELHDLRFYVANIVLIDAAGNPVALELAGNEWQVSEGTDSLALIDLEDATGACADKGTAATNASISGTLPAGSYKGLRFTVGVPQRWNHTDYATAAAPLDLQALAWSWQAGRKYLQVELNPEGGVQRPAPAAAGTTFFVHLGATGCTGNPVTGETVSCARPNRAAVELADFDPAAHKVVLDIAALLQGSDIQQDLGSAPGCMSGVADPECAAIFAKLGLDLNAGTPLGGNLAQSVFTAGTK